MMPSVSSRRLLRNAKAQIDVDGKDGEEVLVGPSNSERGRLQRAFFRFELLQKLFMTSFITYGWKSWSYGYYFHDALLTS